MNKELEPKELAKIIKDQDPLQDLIKVSQKLSINAWVHNANGRAELNWRNTGALGNYDYVALFRQYPDRYDAYSYDSGQWDWVNGRPSGKYLTGTRNPSDSWYCGYCAWDYGEKRYVVIARGQ